jgi:hypothetical protein
VASFYILTPIPGTEQYEEFLRGGSIIETNLDRLDGTHPLFRHPNLGPTRLTDLLLESYRRFFHWPDVARKLARFAARTRDYRTGQALYAIAGYAVQARFAVRRRAHPMAGGARPVRVDGEEDYRSLRREVFGLDQVPLPASLPLSRVDEELNRSARLTAS